MHKHIQIRKVHEKFQCQCFGSFQQKVEGAAKYCVLIMGIINERCTTHTRSCLLGTTSC